MTRGALPRGREGHPPGGPLFFLLFLFLGSAGCTGGNGENGGLSPEQRERLARPLEIYEQLGLLAGPDHFPAVAGFATLAGPADSTYVVFGMSLPNQALRFQRETGGFRAEYSVSLSFLRDTVTERRIEREETVRVPNFAATERTDESVIFQAAIVLEPGTYLVDFDTRDMQSSRGFQVRDTLEIPRYGHDADPAAGPYVVHRASGRSARDQVPDIILNPRHSVPYGDRAPHVYMEWYGIPEGSTVRFGILNDEGGEIWDGTRQLHGGDDEIRYLDLELPTETLPLGQVNLLAQAGDDSTTAGSAPLLVTVSDEWMVANFDEVIEFLVYTAHPEELDSLWESSGWERQQLWERFWDRRDPLPATLANEFRDAFFERVRIAAEQFGEPGRPGWDTDRGQVFIVLGPPDRVLEGDTEERIAGGVEGVFSVQEWIYENAPGGRLSLLFLDRSGFRRYELTSSSEAEFRMAAERLRPES